MWRASIDALLQAEHNPRLRALLAAGQEEGRRGLAAGVLGVAEHYVAPEDVRTIGAVYHALISGVLMRWLLDPDRAPSGADVAAGLRAISDPVGSAPPTDARQRREDPD